MASEILREVCIAGKEIDFVDLADSALVPVESFRQLLYRDGTIEVEDASAADVANVLGALLNHARETILRAGGIAITSLALFLALTLAAPTAGHAEEFFDSQAKGLKIINGSLSEGMISGHIGLTIKTAYFMDKGNLEKDASTKYTMNRIAFYNAVNAHRMLDALLPGVSNPDTKRDMVKSLKFLDTGISLIGRRFGWNEATTKVMYGKVRGLIETRIEDLQRSAFVN